MDGRVDSLARRLPGSGCGRDRIPARRRGATYNLLLEFGSPGCYTAGQTAHKTNRHTDSFDAGLGGTFKNVVVPVVGAILSSDITTWTFTASAVHAVPEPPLVALTLAGLALMGFVTARRWYRRD
jgi:hypothetical protein